MAAPRLHLGHSGKTADEFCDDGKASVSEKASSDIGSVENNSDLDGSLDSRRRNGLRRLSSTLDDLPHRSTFDDELSLQRDVRFFFMDPVEKWKARKRFPWKLSLQVLKIFVVTAQIVMFGDLRMNHVDFVDQTGAALKHFLIKDWEDGRDVHTYPPNFPDYSVYTVPSFYEHLTFAVQQYYALNTSTFGLWMYVYPTKNESDIPPLTFCFTQLKDVRLNLHNDSYYFDTTEVEKCLKLNVSDADLNSTDFSMLDYLRDNVNVTIVSNKLVRASLAFDMKTVHVRKKQASSVPDCFQMAVSLSFENSAHSGQIKVDLANVVCRLACDGSFLYSDYPMLYKAGMLILDICVLFVCVFSLALCIRALIRAEQLKRRTKRYFLTVYEVKMTKDEEMSFLNLWYVLIVVNDVFLIVGTICKFTLEYKIIGSALFTFTGMLLGLGTLFVWIGVLRYFGFFNQYNILILTLKRSFPNCLRFMVCAGLVYMGFLFCGWVVLGPYHMKFRTLLTASACLFALINGDDMFATFTTTSDESQPVVWFARIYLYIFISLFIYIVLSLFISIIMDAYEVVKDRFQYAEDESYLKQFIDKCEDISYGSRPDSHPTCPSCSDCWKMLKRRKRHVLVNEEADESSSRVVNA